MARCDLHWMEPAAARCLDCDSQLCGHCATAVPRLGTLCVECALVRAGIRARNARLYRSRRPTRVHARS